MSKPGSKAVFLDRDGVLNYDHDYTYRIEDLDIMPGVIEGLAKLRDAGFLFFVVTNQSGVARGKFSLLDAMRFNEELAHQLRKHHIHIEAFFVCPHHTDGIITQYKSDCNCRKPRTTFVEQAIRDYQLNREQCYFVGDRDSDIECGAAARLQTVFMANATHGKLMKSKPNFVAKDFMAATNFMASSALFSSQAKS